MEKNSTFFFCSRRGSKPGNPSINTSLHSHICSVHPVAYESPNTNNIKGKNITSHVGLYRMYRPDTYNLITYYPFPNTTDTCVWNLVRKTPRGCDRCRYSVASIRRTKKNKIIIIENEKRINTPPWHSARLDRRDRWRKDNWERNYS